jgi:hypothetical protein
MWVAMRWNRWVAMEETAKRKTLAPRSEETLDAWRAQFTRIERWATTAACGLTLVACSSTAKHEELLAASSQALTSTTITLQEPKDMPILAPVITGSSGVSVSGSGVVTGTTVAMGTSGINVEPDGVLSDVWSRGRATLKDRVKLNGMLHASLTTLGSGVVITGGTDHAPVFDPPASLSWTVTYPTGSGPSYTMNSGQTRTLAPGLYGSLLLNSGGKLNLSSGTYYVTSLDMEAASTLTLDQTNGPVIIYEATTLILRGAINTTSGDSPDLLLGYLGTSPIYVESVFSGAIIAPSAALTLRRVTGTHTGYFYAASVSSVDGAKVQYRAPLAIAVAANPDLEDCPQLIIQSSNLTGRALDANYQALLARYCTMPGTSQCMTNLVGRANADYTAAAKQVVAAVLSPAQYLALSRDRTRKMHAAESNSAQANALCTQQDSDGDWVVDSKDKCPNTPDLSATDDDGCPITTLPQAPSGDDVRKLLNNWGMMFNPLCVDAPPPPEAAGAAVFQTATPGNGTFIVAQRVTNQPAGCPTWYLFQIREMPWQGQAQQPYVVAFQDSEAIAPVGGLAQLPNVPPSLIQFNAKPGDPGERSRLGSIPLEPSGINFRVQAINGNGQRGPWSQWKVPSQADCRALGVVCGTRQH